MIGRVLVVVCVLAGSAAASPAAEKLFEDGRAALAAGQLDAACDAFRRSAELEPRVGTYLNLGDCEEKRGHIALAWGAFSDARALAAKTADARGGEAEKRAAALAPRLPYVTIVTPAQPDLAVQRDGAAVAPAEWNHELPIDPGTHLIVASAPGHVAWQHELKIGEGEKLTVEIPALAADPKAAEVHAPAEAPAQPLARRVLVGVLAGSDSDSDFLVGGRVVGNLAKAGPGTIRAVATLLHTTGLNAASFGAEYMIDFTPQVALAGGAGVGYDIEPGTGWEMLRLGPLVHLGRVDLGLHFQLIYANQAWFELGELGLDYVVW